MNNSEITIVLIRALGYSGATWVNLVLGSHKKAMAMGPATRLESIDSINLDEICFVHRKYCSLWPELRKAGNLSGRLFRRLAEHTGKRTFILNYPPRSFEEREISNKGFRICHIKLVRDGRANLYSKLRHQRPSSEETALEAILRWQVPKWNQIDRKIPPTPENALLVRYEDLLRFPEKTLNKIGNFIGITYPQDTIQFWEHEHHLTAGNTGVLDTLCKMQNEDGWGHHRYDAYNNFIEELKGDPETQFEDEEWRKNLMRNDLLAFDIFLGERNSVHGYDRDDFSKEEQESFWKRLRKMDLTAETSDTISKTLKVGIFRKLYRRNTS